MEWHLGPSYHMPLSAFQTKFLIALDPSFDFKTMVILLGVMNGTTYAGGAFFGAKLADKWGAKTIRAYGWLPAIAMSVLFLSWDLVLLGKLC